MNRKIKLSNTTIGALVSGLLFSGSVMAAAVDSAPGYLKDSSGNIVRSGSGGCVHTGSWNAEMATVVGCDGISLTPNLEVIKGQGAGADHQVLIPLAVLFKLGSAELTATGKQELQFYRDKIAPEMAQFYRGGIVGHTDNQGADAYNQDLSMRRSETVRDYLVSLGAPADKLVILGSGENHPIATNDSELGQQLNRRVAIAVTGELRGEDTMTLPSAALFAPYSAELSAEGEQRLKDYGDEVKRTLSGISKIDIIGHSDNRAQVELSDQIAQARAETVRDYLVQAGVPAERIDTYSAGADSPVASNRTAEGRAENRRVDIYLSGRVNGNT
ncbi:MAG: OmpA family protein [Motiliproteus sp.]